MRRRGCARVRAFAALYRACDGIFRQLSAADLQHGANENAHHIVEKAVCGYFVNQLIAGAGPFALGDRAHGAGELADNAHER